MKVILMIAILFAPVVFGVSIIEKPEFVDSHLFKKECGYEMPQPHDLVAVRSNDKTYLKFDTEVTEVIFTGYRKVPSGEIYLKVVNPIYMIYSPYLEIPCQRAEPHESGK